jgi:hypothetical protein
MRNVLVPGPDHGPGACTRRRWHGSFKKSACPGRMDRFSLTKNTYSHVCGHGAVGDSQASSRSLAAAGIQYRVSTTGASSFGRKPHEYARPALAGRYRASRQNPCKIRSCAQESRKGASKCILGRSGKLSIERPDISAINGLGVETEPPFRRACITSTQR